MSETGGVILMMNNYFHDVATALLLASGVAMWVIYRKFDDSDNPEMRRYFVRMYRSITFLARFSLVWIILAGIPRTIYYREFEWSQYAGRNQIPALIVKHVLAFTCVAAGAYVWVKLSRKMREIKEAQD